MQLSQTRRQRNSSLRWVAACGLAGALAVPALPAAAQPDLVTSSSASTPANCDIQLAVANPTPGDQDIPRTLAMSGTAVDTTAASGVGIAQVEAFLGNRDQGGTFIGAATFTKNPTGAPGAWSLITDIPASVAGGQSVFVYSTSSVSGQEAFISIPVVVGAELPVGLVSTQAEVFCPARVAPAAPASPPVALPAPPTPAPVQPAPAQPAPPQPVVPQPAPMQPAIPAPAPQPPAPTPAPAPPAAPMSPPAAAPAPMATQLNISSPLSPPLAFNTTTLSAPAGAQVTLTYTNDSPISHNWHGFNGPDSSSGTLAATQIIAGPGASDSVTFTAPTQTGNYFFWCDVHPTIMTGTLVVN
jgi:plastocyanin